MEIEIGRGKRGRRAYGLDDIAIVPSRRTRDPEDVDLSWELGPYTLDMPLLASAMDGVVSPATAIEIGQLGGLGVLNLEGIQSRYEDPDAELRKIAEYPPETATAGLQDIYRARDVNPDLMVERIKEIKASGVITAGSLTPQRVEKFIGPALDAGLDIL
ncbi:MAG: GuaB3 family IMP dehydrogenase-related protein, partial [Actinobacteria bacterium]|nr:GuaB3 family IMP dehydrogenase-related protein [Actinomycetota bacterium]